MGKKILVGTITLEKDTIMYNMSFQYAASFEKLTVPKGEYPIYTYARDIREDKFGNLNMDCAYFGFEGIVLEGNVGGKRGEKTSYSMYVRNYDLAQKMIDGHCYFNKIDRAELQLRPEWEITLHDFVSEFGSDEGKRLFSLGIKLKDGAEYTSAE